MFYTLSLSRCYCYLIPQTLEIPLRWLRSVLFKEQRNRLQMGICISLSGAFLTPDRLQATCGGSCPSRCQSSSPFTRRRTSSQAAPSGRQKWQRQRIACFWISTSLTTLAACMITSRMPWKLGRKKTMWRQVSDSMILLLLLIIIIIIIIMVIFKHLFLKAHSALQKATRREDKGQS